MKNLLSGIIFILLFVPNLLLCQITIPVGGGDIGAQINAAEAAMPAAGGKITVQTPANGMCYSYVTPIVITKAIIIQGDGPSTCLSYAGTGAAVSFYGNTTSVPLAGAFADGFGLRDLTLHGAGPTAGQVGLAVGGVANSAGFYGAGLTISNFGLGLQFNRGAWNFKLEHSIFEANLQTVLWPGNIGFGGENVEFDGDTFAGDIDSFADSLHFDTTDGISTLNNLTFISCNFDDAQLVIDNGSGSVRLYSPHFENPQQNSGNQPFVRIAAYTVATDVILDGPDFYNDQTNPYPPAFIEIDGTPTVKITQMRSVNLDGTANVPTNLIINGDANVTLVGDARLRAVQQQYVVASGNPQLWVMGGWDSSNKIVSQTPLIYSQSYTSNDSTSPVVQIGGSGYAPTVGFNLWSGIGASYYGMEIAETGPNELDFCSGGVGPLGNMGNYSCNAGVVNGVFKSTVPDGIAPLSVVSHTPPANLNAWPATFSPAGTQIRNAHITTGKVIMPVTGQATVVFTSSAQFSQTPTCTLSYQASFPVGQALTSNPNPKGITIFGQRYIGVYFICVGN